MEERYASDLFGGREAVVNCIRRVIREGRIRKGYTPYELSDLINPEEERPDTIALEIEAGRAPLTESDAITLIGAVGIKIENALPPLTLTPEDRAYWQQRFNQSPTGPTGAGNNPKPRLEQFIYFTTLKELDYLLHKHPNPFQPRDAPAL